MNEEGFEETTDPSPNQTNYINEWGGEEIKIKTSGVENVLKSKRSGVCLLSFL